MCFQLQITLVDFFKGLILIHKYNLYITECLTSPLHWKIPLGYTYLLCEEVYCLFKSLCPALNLLSLAFGILFKMIVNLSILVLSNRFQTPHHYLWWYNIKKPSDSTILIKLDRLISYQNQFLPDYLITLLFEMVLYWRLGAI